MTISYVGYGLVWLLTIYLGYKLIKHHHTKQFFCNFFTGVFYSGALTIGQLARPSKVLGFFSLSKNWDPTIGIFLVCSLIFIRIVYLFYGKHPSSIDTDFKFRHKESVDWQLICGAIIYGLGWGLSGLSIGPAIVNLLIMDKAVIYIASIMLGSFMYRVWGRKLFKHHDSKKEALLH